MGWCSATELFDKLCDVLFDAKSDKEPVLKSFITALEDADWDCQVDSKYWDHPLIQKIFRELHPDWFEEEISRLKRLIIK